MDNNAELVLVIVVNDVRSVLLACPADIKVVQLPDLLTAHAGLVGYPDQSVAGHLPICVERVPGHDLEPRRAILEFHPSSSATGETTDECEESKLPLKRWQ